MTSDLIAETLAKHQVEARNGVGATDCTCGEFMLAGDFAAHQADAVREALTSDEAVERASEVIVQRAGGNTSVGEILRWAIGALIGEDA